ncbi:DUF4296 domain-containing protein [Flavobacterium sp. UMI-01]|uniref:DUF4296 domain-containing protein n=1 Tax=Flavobacterium sp. UMI-01 TaxID=1441053 RepID=UPI001C7D5CC1|nr:DUF4296 domain-containing protein [Flavobacterium sp. UMI-01]GIZ09940.1 lipoprotein precursor [Flavobacterium sp. UMI-01]
MEKPERLIEQSEMIEIMYDLALLNVIKYQFPGTIENYEKEDLAYIYKKYKIDSLQFVQSNSYYAADYKGYKKMYDAIALKIETNSKLYDSLSQLDQKKLKKKAIVPKKDSLRKGTLKERLEKGAQEATQGVLN